MSKIIEITDSLKESPMFNLSLSSKELFHSNFIAWLIEQYPEEMWAIFAKYTSLKDVYEKYEITYEEIKDGDGKKVGKKIIVKREEQNIDIMFEVQEKDANKTGNKEIKKIIIENKVKSLPYKEQLSKYASENHDCCYILLTLSEPINLMINGTSRICTVPILRKSKKNEIKGEAEWIVLTY